MDLTQARETYRPSGAVRWGSLVPWALLAMWVSLAMGAVLHVAFRVGIYLIFLVPAIASIPAALIATYAVKAGHCRSGLVAALLGVVAGVAVYVGHYYVGMVHDVGHQAIGRIDRLPDYIAWRMRTEVETDLTGPRRKEEAKPEAGTNWFRFVCELGVVVVIVAAPAFGMASRPYCEACGGWMKKQAFVLPVGSAPAVAKHVQSGSLDALPELTGTQPPTDQEHTRVEVEYCPTSGRQEALCPAYVSVTQYLSQKPGKKKPGQLKPSTLLRRVALTPQERLVLVRKCCYPAAEGEASAAS